MAGEPKVQQITQELRAWIINQVATGHDPAGILHAMEESGWNKEVAVVAIESTLKQHLARRDQQLGLPPAVAVPEPIVAGVPLGVDAGDRQVPVLATLQLPRVVVFGELLSELECDALIAAARPRLEPSLTVATETADYEESPDRTSLGMFFERDETGLIRRLEQRFARLLDWPAENGENLQVLCYKPGAEYKAHHDYFEPDDLTTPELLAHGGQRVGTLLVYLNEPEQGGATQFPDVGLDVMPRRGHAVFFSYCRPHPSTRTLHAGLPVLAGEKWIATKWLREHRFG
ncbi:MAG: 2OG-Fe(II) oxygenase [Ottowia sp.]|nr:2OG-Fe(II) oxygenase [Ottowia sp.]